MVRYEIREPRVEDAATIADLHVATWREAYAHLLPESYFDEEHIVGRHRMWDRILGDPRSDLTVRMAERDGEVFGFALAGPSRAQGDAAPPRDHQLYAIYVAAAHHGGGAGQALIDAALGTRPAMLWVAKENPRAIAFYLRNGFAFDGVEQIDPAAPAITDARMVR